MTFRQWHQFLPRLGGNLDCFDSRHLRGLLQLLNSLVDPFPRDGNHHYARAGLLASYLRDRLIERVPNDQFLQRDSVPEAQTSRTEPTYRTRRDLQNPVAIVFDPQLGVERAMKQAECIDRPLQRPSDLGLYGRFQSRRGDVDCLFEKWPDQRVRLIEDRQHSQLASVGQAFNRDFRPVDIVLHLDEPARLLTQSTDLRALQEPANTLERLHKFLGVIGANHTTAAGEREWFEHAGKGDFPRGNNRARVRMQGKSPEERNLQPGIPQPLARTVLIAADVGRFWRMPSQSEFMAGASAG